MKFIVLISTALFIIMATTPDNNANAQQADNVWVMSYNIRYNNPDDGVNWWENRKERVANLVQFHEPVVVGMQEVLQGQLSWLDANLENYNWIGVGRTDGKEDGEFSPIFYDTSRLELLAHDTFWLSPTPEKPSRGWDAALPRIVTWGRFRDRQTQKEFLALNTHFDHRGEQARLESAKLIVQKIEDLAGDGLPVILTGDFNTEPGSEPYKVLAGELQDAFEATKYPHYGPRSTYMDEDGGFSVSSGEGGRRIDYIFSNQFANPVRHGILSTFRDGRFPSDHLPVLAEIELE